MPLTLSLVNQKCLLKSHFELYNSVCVIQNLTRPTILSKNASKPLQNPSCQGFSVSAMSQASQEKVWEGHDVSRKSKSFTLILLQSCLFQTLSPSHSDRHSVTHNWALSLYGASQISDATSSVLLLLFTCIVYRAAFFAWRAPILSWPRIMCSQVRMLEFLEPSREMP